MTTIYPIEQMLLPVYCEQVAQAVREGAVIAFATDTVYGIGANAFDEKAIERIYQLKQRPSTMALQILVAQAQVAKELVQWNEAAEKLAQAYWPGALTLILKPNEKGQNLRRGFEGLGLRVPAQPALLHLLHRLEMPLASTSANIHGQAVWTKPKDLINSLQDKVDFILTGGVLEAASSSVVSLLGEPTLLREGSLSRHQLEDTLGYALKEI